METSAECLRTFLLSLTGPPPHPYRKCLTQGGVWHNSSATRHTKIPTRRWEILQVAVPNPTAPARVQRMVFRALSDVQNRFLSAGTHLAHNFLALGHIEPLVYSKRGVELFTPQPWRVDEHAPRFNSRGVFFLTLWRIQCFEWTMRMTVNPISQYTNSKKKHVRFVRTQ